MPSTGGQTAGCIKLRVARVIRREPWCPTATLAVRSETVGSYYIVILELKGDNCAMTKKTEKCVAGSNHQARMQGRPFVTYVSHARSVVK